MATSSFTRNFKVTKEQSGIFADLMKGNVKPTLNKEFQSKIWKPSDEQMKQKIVRALSK